MATVNYSLSLDEALLRRAELESKLRHKSVAEIFQETIALGLPMLPPIDESSMDSLVADSWEKLGPAPEIDYDRL